MSAYGSRIGFQANPLLVGAVSNFTVDASTKGLAWYVDPQTTGAIDVVSFRYGARTGTPPTYLIQCEEIGTDGLPSGTAITGTTTTFTPPADTSWNGTQRDITLAASVTRANRGDTFAIVIRHSSGTVDASNCSSFTLGYTGQKAGSFSFPAPQTLTGGTWTKSVALGSGTIGWRSGGTVYGSPMLSVYLTVTANTAGHRSGGYITIPTAFGTSTTVEGVTLVGRYWTATGNSFKVAIWDSSWTVVATRTIDADWCENTTAQRPATFYFDSPVVLTNGTKYYVGLEVIGGVVGISGLVCNSSADVAAYEMGANMGLVTYNGTTTTETASTYPMVQLICSDLAVPSGGLLVPRGFVGGFAQ